MLRRQRLAGILLIVLVAAGSSEMFAQGRPVRLNSAPAPFRTFYKKFARAVNKGQVKTIASMTSFPFTWGFDAGDEGVWTREEFIKKAGGFLMPQPLIFNDVNPEFRVERGRYYLTNSDDATHYSFEKKGGVYKFVSYVAEP